MNRNLKMMTLMMMAGLGAPSIEAQEAAGQRTMIASEELPRKLEGAHQWELEQLGFKFGNEISELFIEAQLPPGWTKVATSHAMHSDILDEQGRKRAGIFYKAAFYDERADMSMVSRYSISAYEKTEDGASYQLAITDSGKVAKSFGVWGSADANRQRDQIQSEMAVRDKLEAEAKAWLKKRRPLWPNPMLYWNEGPVA